MREWEIQYKKDGKTFALKKPWDHDMTGKDAALLIRDHLYPDGDFPMIDMPHEEKSPEVARLQYLGITDIRFSEQ